MKEGRGKGEGMKRGGGGNEGGRRGGGVMKEVRVSDLFNQGE